LPVDQKGQPLSYGFVGAGAITAAIVEGLSAAVPDPPAIFLSPRGRAVAHGLASRFPNVRVCDSNQDVLDSATAIVLAVRPPTAQAVLAELTFRPEHVLLSVLTGVRLEQLRQWTAPAEQVVRAIPLPSAAAGRSLTVLYPDNAVARELFGRVGGLLTPSQEPTVDAFSAATATFAAHLDYLATIADWLADQGVDPDVAAAYLTHIFGQLGQSLARTDLLEALAEEYMTPGGINQQLKNDLRDEGVPDLVRRALDRVLARLRG
jgi:pyrroline-5-carboxylate reductase